ncbi:MAG: peptidyl-prolyl cis-trans isomerase [Pirellulales bacterium]
MISCSTASAEHRDGFRRGRGRLLVTVLGGLAIVAACVAIRYFRGSEPASAQWPAQKQHSTARRAASSQPRRPPKTNASAAQSNSRKRKRQIVAQVNNERITRDELADEALMHYGEAVLESLVNKHLIAQECRRQGIEIGPEDVDAEVERMAGRFNLPVDQWLKMLESERGIKPTEYARDIIWPTLALRKLAGPRLTVDEAELREAYETKYGEAVQARLIAVEDRDRAEKLRRRAAAEPARFGKLAKDHSEDLPSAAAMGRIQPIRRNGTYEQLEQVAFEMEPGEVSPVIPAGGRYLILKKEATLPAREVDFQRVAAQLEELIRDNKLRQVAGKVFRKLQEDAQVVNVLADPQRRKQMPGVAATINGQPISLDQLAEECIARHGEDVLEGMINRRLIEQACARQGVEVTEADLQRELARTARRGVPPKEDGSPDVEAWLKRVAEQEGVSREVYMHDSVWPSVALRKFNEGTVKVTEEDLKKGYESNYGPRVRCLAIVLGSYRRAQEVWEMARENNTREYFGDLAEQYSIEPGSRALRGEVPPIRRHGGRPLLEKEAFKLTEGELSGIVQVGDRFVLLRCEGRTEPIDVDFDQVRDEIHRDLAEKKQRLAMAEHFQRLQDAAQVTNYLAGTSRSPREQEVPGKPGR